MDDNLTPAMKQYMEIKQKYPDCLLMFRMGDFYETFFDDAVAASRELEIVLTSRGQGEKKAPLAGIPYHSLEPYLAKLVRKGYKVAICEQMEDPRLVKGIVKRDVVRIVTPGTVIEDSMLEQKSNNYIMSLYVSGEHCSVALCDVSTGELLAMECTDSQLSNEIAKYQPAECVMPHSLAVNQDMMKQLGRQGVFVTKYDDMNFKSERSKNSLLSHFNVSSLDGFGLSDMQSAACGALIRYIHENHLSAQHISKIRKLNSGSIMSLDAASYRNLEISNNMRDGSSRGSLLGVLDKTKTSMGCRLLRRWLKAPLLDVKEIRKRLNAVNAFYQNSMLRDDIRNALNNIADIERILSRINCGSAMPKDLLALKYSLKQCPAIREELIPAVNRMLGQTEENLLFDSYLFEDLSEVISLIDSSIREDAASVIREGGIIKPEFNEILAKLHEVKNNSKEFIRNLEAKEKERTGIKSLRIGFNHVFGYYLEVSKTNMHLVPKDYIRKQTTANGERFVTEELKKQEEMILHAEERINSLEYEIYIDVVKRIAVDTEALQDTANKIAVLDVLQSLALAAAENNYVMPTVDDADTIELTESRHPVIEQIERGFVPNDILLNNNEMMIITGPNMAGKSTVMRQLALNVLLAQCGSFVAASKAHIGVVDRIFTRVGAQDDLSMGQSTFMVEMLEVANILNNATRKSLIILDEIGRGTSTFDGVAIAWAVAEHIYGAIKAKTMFATHYHVLNKLAEQLPSVKNCNIAVKEENGEIIFLRKLITGGTDRSYGIHVAKLAGVPAETLARASEIQQKLEEEDSMLQKLNAKLHVEQKRLKDLFKE